MKPILFSFLFALAAACGGSDSGGDTNNTKKIEVDKEKQSTDGSSLSACAEEITLECAEGSVDGCGVTNEAGDTLTLSHICVPASETFAGPACEQEIARECGEGLVDACGLSPALSTIHVCVPAMADATEVDIEEEPTEEPAPDLDPTPAAP
jgi:hypothetical protein